MPLQRLLVIFAGAERLFGNGGLGNAAYVNSEDDPYITLKGVCARTLSCEGLRILAGVLWRHVLETCQESGRCRISSRGPLDQGFNVTTAAIAKWSFETLVPRPHMYALLALMQ
jgi:hypothetical protein